jgi:trehalose/maltose hydrolase-like predicted phosphorylase
VLLGPERVRRSTILKQPDVLMAHHLLDDGPPGSLDADLDHYLPRTAHGSSLSPAVCAALLARAGRADEALRWFDVAARIDLDDLTGTTGGGLHLATMGGLWQAVVGGFAGVRPTAAGLVVAPALPNRWDSLSVTVRSRGIVVRVTVDDRHVDVDCDEPVPVVIGGRTSSAPIRLPLDACTMTRRTSCPG